MAYGLLYSTRRLAQPHGCREFMDRTVAHGIPFALPNGKLAFCPETGMSGYCCDVDDAGERAMPWLAM